MFVLVAPNSFKGSLDAAAAAEAMVLGAGDAAREARRAIRTEGCPVADGGEGTAAVLCPGSPGLPLDVTGADGAAIRARWRRGVGVGLLDVASVIGLPMVAPARRDPERLTSYGVGEAMMAMAGAGIEEVGVALGGSATVDFGLGVAAALGWRFEPRPVGRYPVPGDLLRLRTLIPPASPYPARVTALCDVRTTLGGSSNGIRLYGPQKGATPEQLSRLEAARDHWVALLEAAGVRCGALLDEPGSGAAGGLGFGLRVLAGARLRSGAAFVLSRIGFDARCRDCDLVLTGEGRFDGTSLEGKATGAVIESAAALGREVVVIAGSADASAATTAGVEAVSLTDLAGSESAAIAEAAAWLRRASRMVVASRLAR